MVEAGFIVHTYLQLQRYLQTYAILIRMKYIVLIKPIDSKKLYFFSMSLTRARLLLHQI